MSTRPLVSPAQQARTSAVDRGAVWRGERLRATYRSWRKTATRRLEPLGLVLKGDEWYLVASHHDRPATYRLDSFVAVEATGERFDPPAGFDLAASWRDSVERFERDLFDGRATLRVRPDALDRIDELGAPAAEAIRRAPPEAGGARTVRRADGDGEADGAGAARLGASIEALEPPELRAAILALASEAIAAYGIGPSRP